jgi:glycosyltransferase involved in cell wall biosynthesis
MGDALRVLQVSSGLDPQTGGTASAAVNVALAARRAGVAVTLAYPFAPEAAERLAPDLSRLAAAGVDLQAFEFARVDRGLAARWAIAPKLNRFLHRTAGDFDVIHMHSTWVGSSVAAVRAARRAGRPMALMPHEALTRFDMARGRNAALRIAKSVLRGWYLSRLDQIIVSSELERLNSELEHFPGTVTIPHPVIDETAPAPAAPPPRANGPLHLGFLGRFDPKKNLHRLVRALASAPGVQLSIAGGGDERYRAAILDLIVRHKLDDRVTWLGFLSGGAKQQFFQRVDAVVMPSEFECFGMVAAEALGAGTPVILSPTVGVADMIVDRDCGTIIPPRADALGFCFRDLADGAELARWRTNARRVALELFSFAAHGTRLRDAYAHAVALAPPG